MSLFQRHLAPLDASVWALLEAQSSETLKANLTGRRLVEIRGPLGLAHHAESNGRLQGIDSPGFDIQCGIRQVQPMIEARKAFSLSLAELQNLQRGARDINLDPLIEAAREMATFEDSVIFKGLASAGVKGLLGSELEPMTLAKAPVKFLDSLASALRTMRIHTLEGGLNENYHLVVGPETYQYLSAHYVGSHSLLQEVQTLLMGQVLATRAVNDEVLLVAQREDAFELVLGQDFSMGYQQHDQQSVGLYLMESFTFLLRDPSAAMILHFSEK
jgi:uncharacterized linocin/CFP29 family protein